MIYTIIIVSFIFVIIFHLLPVIKKKDKKQIWFSIVIMFISLIILMLDAMGKDIPNPTDLIEKIISIF